MERKNALNENSFILREGERYYVDCKNKEILFTTSKKEAKQFYQFFSAYTAAHILNELRERRFTVITRW